MSDYRSFMTSRIVAEARSRSMALRPDMQREFDAAGGLNKEGPIWTLMRGDRVLGMGGLEPRGAAGSAGWLLVAEGLTRRDWAMGRRLIVEALEWARRHAIRRVHAFPEASMDGAMRLLLGLGFVAAGREGDNIIMTRELT